jgi:hypothetical protein
VLRIAEFTLLASRLLLAALFLLAGASKLIDPAGSRKALRDFGLPAALARPLFTTSELENELAMQPSHRVYRLSCCTTIKMKTPNMGKVKRKQRFFAEHPYCLFLWGRSPVRNRGSRSTQILLSGRALAGDL